MSPIFFFGKLIKSLDIAYTLCSLLGNLPPHGYRSTAGGHRAASVLGEVALSPHHVPSPGILESSHTRTLEKASPGLQRGTLGIYSAHQNHKVDLCDSIAHTKDWTLVVASPAPFPMCHPNRLQFCPEPYF